jgi:hypothetical protein
MSRYRAAAISRNRATVISGNKVTAMLGYYPMSRYRAAAMSRNRAAVIFRNKVVGSHLYRNKVVLPIHVITTVPRHVMFGNKVTAMPSCKEAVDTIFLTSQPSIKCTLYINIFQSDPHWAMPVT